MDLFETKSVIGEKSMKELKLHLLAPGQMIFAVLGSIFSLYSAIIFESVQFCLLIIPFALLIPYSVKQNIKITVKRFRESTSDKECEITTSFDEDSFKCINHSTNGTATFSYDSVKKFVETKNYYALFTEANQYVLVNKNEIGSVQKTEEFISFINSRCKNLKKKEQKNAGSFNLSCLRNCSGFVLGERAHNL